MALIATIGNQPVSILDDGNASLDNTQDGNGVLVINVKDLTGLKHFQPGQVVELTDTVAGFTFEGYVNDSQETPLPPSSTIISQVSCVDGHYIPGKRYYAGPEYQYRYAGDIATDLLRIMGPEGIVDAYAVDNDQSVNDWQAGSLSSTSAQNNIPGGDLELSKAGAALEIVEAGSTFSTGTPGNTQVVTTPAYPIGPITPVQALGQNSFNAIKMTAVQNVNNGNNTYSYVQFASGGGYTIPGGQVYFCYDLFVLASSPEIKIALDIVFTDGTNLRTLNPSQDEQGIAPHPNNDLSGLANVGNWYHRGFYVGGISGKTVSYYTIACEGDKVGTYIGYVQNVNFANFYINGTVLHSVYAGASSVTAQQMQSYGYTTTVNVATCHNPYDYRLSPSYSLSSVGISASTIVSWDAIQTDTTGAGSVGYTGTKNGSHITIGYSIDNGASYQVCNNNSPLTNFPTGLSLSGISILFFQFLVTGLSPEDTPYLTDFQFTCNPGYAGTKTDVLYDVTSTGAWNAGTLTNVNASSGILYLNGAIRNWDNGDFSNQTLYGSNAPSQIVINKQFRLATNPADVRSRFDFAPQYQDFTMEVDVQVGANYTLGMVYRTTGWQNANDTYAYICDLNLTSINIGKGTNTSSGAGAHTSVATATVSLTAGDWHRLKIVVSTSGGVTTHKAYLDNVLMLTATDSTWPSAGYCGLRLFNGSGGAQFGFFDNFGITPALSGTWISPSVSLASAIAYYNSSAYFVDVSSDHSNCTVTCDISTNGGSTWTTITNGNGLTGNTPFESNTIPPVPIFTPGQSLSGVSAMFRFTLTTSTATAQPAVSTVYFSLLGSFSGSGYRISEPMLLDGIGRVGNTLAAWTGIEPANTGIFVDTSLDGVTWTQNVAPGLPVASGSTTYAGTGVIAGITAQTDPAIDDFSADSSDEYTSTYRTGGNMASWVWNTSINQLTTSGGSDALLLLNTPTTGADVDLACVMDTSDNGGFVWRYQDRSNFYYVTVHDASNFTAPNTVNLYRVVGNIKTLLASASINFTRLTPHTFRLIHLASVITFSMDGATIITASDNLISAAGFSGLYTTDNGGSSVNFYLFRQMFYGQIVDSLIVYSRVRLTSTDPTVTPQVMNLTVSAHDGNIQAGALIPLTSYSLLNGNKNTLSAILDDLAKRSGNYWWRIKGKPPQAKLSFQEHTATPAPWVLTGNDTIIGQAATQTLQITNINDHYRNNEWITGGIDTIPDVKSFTGDGTTTTFNVPWPIDSVSSITLNNAVQTVGIKGVDTGENWYYTQGQTGIVGDTSAIPLNDMQTLIVAYAAQVDITVNIPRPSEIARLAALDLTTGLVDEVDDGKGLTKVACIQLGQGQLDQFAQPGKQAQFTTMRAGLEVGQLLPIFGVMGIFAGAFLLTDVKISWLNTVVNGVTIVQPLYAVTGMSGPIVPSWERWMVSLGN